MAVLKVKERERMKPIQLSYLVSVLLFAAVGCENNVNKIPEATKPTKPAKSLPLTAQNSDVNKVKLVIPEESQENPYLEAVREFADNVLKYGRDTYGPKHTPLFVDGLNVNTHEPVTWIEPNGDRWVFSNPSSQQTFFRTLEGLTTLTGDPKYKQAAMEAIEHVFDHLQTSNGLLPWGGHQLYDATADMTRGNSVHELKGIYPYYELMWKVSPQATEYFIEAFWSGHVLDWSNLNMNRHCYELRTPFEEPWKYEYKGGPIFLEGEELSFFNTASDLIYAAVELTRLSENKDPLVWARRLAKRYVDVRDPKTGISYGMYTLPEEQKVPDSYDDVLKKLVPGATDFPVSTFPGGMINPKPVSVALAIGCRLRG